MIKTLFDRILPFAAFAFLFFSYSATYAVDVDITGRDLPLNENLVEGGTDDNLITRSLEGIFNTNFYADFGNGTDKITVEGTGGTFSSAEISVNGMLRNFEEVELSGNNDIWTITGNDEDLEGIDARGGDDTIVFGQGQHDAGDIHSGGRYRNFEQAELSNEDDIWVITDNDNNLTSIDALEGTDILEKTIEDSDGNGIFNGTDSDFTFANVGSGDFAKYFNFEGVAVRSTDGDDIWHFSPDDFASEGWEWVSGGEGTDTIRLGNGNHDASGLQSGGRYRNFERVELSDDDNVWTFTGNDENLERIDALGGTDTFEVDIAEGFSLSLDGDNFGDDALYRNFESLSKEGEGRLVIEREVDLGSGGNLFVGDGTLLLMMDFDNPASENSAKIIAGAISAESESSIAVSAFDVVSLAQTNNMSVTVFEGDTSSASATLENILEDPGMFTKLSTCTDGICLSIDSEQANVRDEIESSFEAPNLRGILTSVYEPLRTGSADSDKSEILNALNDPDLDGQTVRELLPSEHAGIEHEMIGLQRDFFDSIEYKIVEAVKYMPWDNPHDIGVYGAFSGGFEKNTSGDLYEIGSRGIVAGVHRFLFDRDFGIGIAGGVSFLETANERVNEEAKGFHSALYAKYDSGRITATAIGAFSMHDYDSSRESDFGTINGETDIKTYGAKFSSGMHILNNLPVKIRPSVSFSFAKASTDSYTENGGLDIRQKNSSMTSSEAGAKINISFNALKTILRTVVQPEVEAGVFYDFSSSGNNLDVSVLDTDFTVLRPQVSDELRYFVGGQVVLSDNKNLAFKIGYKADFWNDMRSYSGTGQFHIRF